MVRTVSFEGNNGNIGRRIDEFLEEKQRKLGSLFKLIDIKYTMGAHCVGAYSYTSALIIFEDGMKIKEIDKNEN